MSRDAAPVVGESDVSYEVWQDGAPVAWSSGPDMEARNDAMHYAMMYGQDGPVTVYKVHTVREPIA